jgi:L-asparaginase II
LIEREWTRATLSCAQPRLSGIGGNERATPGATSLNASNTSAEPQPTTRSAFGGDAKLIEVIRGGFVESVHRGSIAVVDTAGMVTAWIGNVNELIFLRSGAKPFQVMPALLAGGMEKFGVTERELAVMCSSHSGEPHQTDAVYSVLAKIGLDERALRCGIHPPLSVEVAADRWRHGMEPSPVCNNCSGAHAGMLMACQAAGWTIHDYGDPEHPLQQHIRHVIRAFAGVVDGELEEAIDMCTVPTFRVPLFRAACMFARLASGSGVSETLSHVAGSVRRAMTTYPEMVGGEHRFDSDLMQFAAGNLVAKGGADGFQGVGAARTGVGVAVKVSDGSAPATTTAAMRALTDLELLSREPLGSLDEYREPKILNRQGKMAGRVVPTFHLRELR